MMLALVVLVIIGLFLIYLLLDLLRTGNINTFIDNWLRRTLWFWLPIYALRRMLKEVFFKKK